MLTTIQTMSGRLFFSVSYASGAHPLPSLNVTGQIS
jgi:hypothetical protein